MTGQDYVTLREYIEAMVAAERERTNIRLKALDKALQLQAEEYARRLDELNHSFARDRERQNHFLDLDKFEDYIKSEKTAREAALLRIDEKFSEYVKRYEQRQREVDQAITTQQTVAETAQRFAEDASAKANRNIAILGIIIAAFVVVMNLLGIG